MFVSLGRDVYRWDGGDRLLKIAHGTKRKSKDGREWFWNGETKRWRLTDEYKQKRSRGRPKVGDRRTDQRGREWEFAESRRWRLVREPRPGTLDDYDAQGVQNTIAQGRKIIEALDSDDIADQVQGLKDLFGVDLDLDSLMAEASKANDKFEQTAQKARNLSSDLQKIKDASTGDKMPHLENLPPLDALNNIVGFPINNQKRLQQLIDEQFRQLEDLGIEASIYIEELKDKERFQGLKDSLKDTEELRGKAHQMIRDRLQMLYEGRISKDDAKIAAMHKRVYELLHPRKLIRVPQGTSQREYYNIVARLAAEDKQAIKQYTIARPKGYKTVHQRKQDARDKKRKEKGKGKGKNMGKAVTLAGVPYMWEGRILKAAKTPSPGQMSLLGDWDESQHSRDESGKFSAKDRAISKMREAVPGAIAKLDRGADKLEQKIAKMPAHKLQDYDFDGDLNDNHLVDAILHLDSAAKAGVHESEHAEIDEVVDSHDEHVPELQQRYDHHYKRLSDMVDRRIADHENQVDDIHTGTLDSFEESASSLLDSVDSLDQWQDAKVRLKELYGQAIARGTAQFKAIGAARDVHDDLHEALHDSLMDKLDAYSDDPEDWDDWSGDDFGKAVTLAGVPYVWDGDRLVKAMEGDRITRNGKTYVLNRNHRWTRGDSIKSQSRQLGRGRRDEMSSIATGVQDKAAEKEIQRAASVAETKAHEYLGRFSSLVGEARDSGYSAQSHQDVMRFIAQRGSIEQAIAADAASATGSAERYTIGYREERGESARLAANGVLSDMHSVAEEYLEQRDDQLSGKVDTVASRMREHLEMQISEMGDRPSPSEFEKLSNSFDKIGDFLSDLQEILEDEHSVASGFSDGDAYADIESRKKTVIEEYGDVPGAGELVEIAGLNSIELIDQVVSEFHDLIHEDIWSKTYPEEARKQNEFMSERDRLVAYRNRRLNTQDKIFENAENIDGALKQKIKQTYQRAGQAKTSEKNRLYRMADKLSRMRKRDWRGESLQAQRRIREESEMSMQEAYEKIHLQKSLTLAGVPYVWDGDRLVKAAKLPKKHQVVEGQTSLFGDSEWDESKHSRDEGGKFTSGGGGSSSAPDPSHPHHKMGKRLLADNKDSYYIPTSKKEAEYHGLNPSHPGIGWDEQHWSEYAHAYQTGGNKAVAQKAIADMRENDDGGGIYRELVAPALNSIDWNKLHGSIQSHMDGAPKPVDGLEGVIMEHLGSQIEDAQDIVSQGEEADEDELKDAHKLLAELRDPELAKKYVKREAHPRNENFELIEDIADHYQGEGIDLEQVGAAIASGMKLDKHKGEEMSVIPWEESDAGKDNEAVKNLNALVDWNAVADHVRVAHQGMDAAKAKAIADPLTSFAADTLSSEMESKPEWKSQVLEKIDQHDPAHISKLSFRGLIQPDAYNSPHTLESSKGVRAAVRAKLESPEVKAITENRHQHQPFVDKIQNLVHKAKYGNTSKDVITSGIAEDLFGSAPRLSDKTWKPKVAAELMRNYGVSSAELEQMGLPSQPLVKVSGVPYIVDGRSLRKVAVGDTVQRNGQTYTLNQNHRWEKVKHAVHGVAHAADHIGESVVSWKAGKVLGGAIASLATAAGADPLGAQIMSETVVQAGTAAALHHTKQSRMGKASARDTAAYFVAQAAAAFMGKVAHHGAEWGLEHTGVSHMYQQVGAILGGKGAGIGTVTAANRSGVAAKVVDHIVQKGGHDLKFFEAAMVGGLRKAAEYPPELQRLFWQLTAAAGAIALHEMMSASHNAKLGKAAKLQRVMYWNKIPIGVSHEVGDRRHGRAMKAGYGHIRGSYGDAADGMSLDVYIGRDLGSQKVFKIRQVFPNTGEFDEYKYVIGVHSQNEARELYLGHMPGRFYGGVESVDFAKELAKYKK